MSGPNDHRPEIDRLASMIADGGGEVEYARLLMRPLTADLRFALDALMRLNIHTDDADRQQAEAAIALISLTKIVERLNAPFTTPRLATLGRADERVADLGESVRAAARRLARAKALARRTGLDEDDRELITAFLFAPNADRWHACRHLYIAPDTMLAHAFYEDDPAFLRAEQDSDGDPFPDAKAIERTITRCLGR